MLYEGYSYHQRVNEAACNWSYRGSKPLSEIQFECPQARTWPAFSPVANLGKERSVMFNAEIFRFLCGLNSVLAIVSSSLSVVSAAGICVSVPESLCRSDSRSSQTALLYKAWQQVALGVFRLIPVTKILTRFAWRVLEWVSVMKGRLCCRDL